MNINQAKRETLAQIAAGNAVIWSSGSGLGKSTTAFSIFEYLRDRDAQPSPQHPNGLRWGFGQIFAATQTPPDLIGYQFKGEKEYDVLAADGTTIIQKKITVTEPSVPLWMMMSDGKGGPQQPAFMFDRCFLLIDEYGQGDSDVKRAVAEIFLNGGTAPWYLPPGSVRLACTNQGARYGVSKDFDFCIARRAQINIEGDIDATLKYMNKPYYHQGKMWTTLPVIKAWAAQNPNTVFEAEPKEQGPWCNPRQLCAVDRYLQEKFAMQGNTNMEPETISSIEGMIGAPATTSLAAYMQFALDLPQYADVVADPAGCEVPTKADMQMLMAYQLAAYTQVQDLAPCIQYIKRLPSDMGIAYVASLLARDYKNLITQPAMQAWIAQNATLVSLVASINAQ